MIPMKKVENEWSFRDKIGVKIAWKWKNELLEDFSIFFERKEKILKGKGLPNILDFIDMIKAKKVHFRSIWAKCGVKIWIEN